MRSPLAGPGTLISALVVALAALLFGACTPRRPREGGAPTAGAAAVNGTTLYYEAAGRGRVVVLLEGGNLDLRMWDDQFAELARSHRVVRYDVRGFGRSGPATAPYSAHEDLHALLRHLNVARASLVGLSLGGRIAIDFALAHPEMVEALVLAGPGLSGWQWSGGDTLWVPTARTAFAARDSVGMAMAWLESDYMRPAMERPALAARLRTLAALNSSHWLRDDPEREASPPAVGRLREIRTPTLLVLGSRDVPDIRRIVDTLGVSIPGARTVVFEGAGHMLNMEQPARFTRAVLEFLREH